jgi:DNA-3-methyladenine glycosylase
MFGPPGLLYVYRSYGMHWCANVVTGPPGSPSAVLLRALEPLEGIGAMRTARWPGGTAGADRDLCRGPGRLCSALGIGGPDDGTDLLDSRSSVRLLTDGLPPPQHPTSSVRIGISVATDLQWRFSVPDHPCLSRKS